MGRSWHAHGWVLLSAGCSLEWQSRTPDASLADAAAEDAMSQPDTGARPSDDDGGHSDAGSEPDDGAAEPADAASDAASDASTDASADDAVPTDGLSLWLRADRGVEADDGGVTAWRDQSPSHQDSSAATLAARPSYRPASPDGGTAAVLFDGVDDRLVLNGGFDDFSAGMTLLAVVRHAPTTGDYVPYFECSNGQEINDVGLGRFKGQPHYEFDDDSFNDSSVADGPVQLISVLLRPSREVTLRRNGVSVAVHIVSHLPGVLRRANVFVGGSLYGDAVPFAGEIQELLVYARALEGTQLDTYHRPAPPRQ
jgi:hypothetical protein